MVTYPMENSQVDVMNSSNQNSLINPLVDHELALRDYTQWRKSLVEEEIMTLEATLQLTEQALTAAYRTLLVMRYRQFNSQQLLDAIDEQAITWSVELPHEYQQGAICY